MTLPEGWTIKVNGLVDDLYVFDITTTYMSDSGPSYLVHKGITREATNYTTYMLANLMRKLGVRINKKMSADETRALWNNIIVPLLTDALNNQ